MYNIHIYIYIYIAAYVWCMWFQVFMNVRLTFDIPGTYLYLLWFCSHQGSLTLIPILSFCFAWGCFLTICLAAGCLGLVTVWFRFWKNTGSLYRCHVRRYNWHQRVLSSCEQHQKQAWRVGSGPFMDSRKKRNPGIDRDSTWFQSWDRMGPWWVGIQLDDEMALIMAHLQQYEFASVPENVGKPENPMVIVVFLIKITMHWG